MHRCGIPHPPRCARKCAQECSSYPADVGPSVWTLLCWKVSAIADLWNTAIPITGLSGGLGCGLCAGRGVSWSGFTRFSVTFLFHREAMGIGDMHLMLRSSRCDGRGRRDHGFFIAPFFRGWSSLFTCLSPERSASCRFGPYWFGAAFFVITYCPIAARMGRVSAGWRSHAGTDLRAKRLSVISWATSGSKSRSGRRSAHCAAQHLRPVLSSGMNTGQDAGQGLVVLSQARAADLPLMLRS